MERKASKRKLSFPLYVTKRADFSKKKYWLIRIGGILLAFLMAGIVCTILSPGSFGTFYSEMIRGCFDFSDISSIIDLLVTFSLLLLISIILTPAFKMHFWNIGAEGQILIGCMAAAGMAKFAPSSWPNILILFLALIVAQAASTIWSIIPAIFKAFFNTNETLFTLMMNYVAISFVAALTNYMRGQASSLGKLNMATQKGWMPKVFGLCSYYYGTCCCMLFHFRKSFFWRGDIEHTQLFYPGISDSGFFMRFRMDSGVCQRTPEKSENTRRYSDNHTYRNNILFPV